MDQTNVEKLRKQIYTFLDNYGNGHDFYDFAQYCHDLTVEQFGYDWAMMEDAEGVRDGIDEIWQSAKAVLTTQDFLSHVNEGTYGEEYDDFIFVMNVLSVCAETMKYIEEHEDKRLEVLKERDLDTWAKNIYPKIRPDTYVTKKIPVPAELGVEITMVLYSQNSHGKQRTKIDRYYVTKQTDTGKEIKEYTFEELELELRAAILKSRK